MNFNSFKDAIICIEKISNFVNLGFTIVVVDNNSLKINEVELLLKNKYITKLILLDENIGFGRANNVGIDWAINNLEFKFLSLLNTDAFLTANSIENVLKVFDVDSSIGLASCRIMYEANPDLVWYGGGEFDNSAYLPSIKDLNMVPTKIGALSSRKVDFVSGCFMVFSHECIKDIGGFDPDFFMYYEDLELCLRVKKAGYGIFYVADSIIYHRVGGSMGATDYKGLNPKNPNVLFHFEHKMLNLFLTYYKHSASKGAFISFIIYYFSYFSYKFFNILINSNNRGGLLEVTGKVLRKIRFSAK